MTLELSNWFWEGVMMKGRATDDSALTAPILISPGGANDGYYRDSTQACRRSWVSRLCNLHAPVLFEKSGAEGEYRRSLSSSRCSSWQRRMFFPGYRLLIEEGKGSEPLPENDPSERSTLPRPRTAKLWNLRLQRSARIISRGMIAMQ